MILMSNYGNHLVSRPFCLVESHSQDTAANAGVLSVYLTTARELHPLVEHSRNVYDD